MPAQKQLIDIMMTAIDTALANVHTITIAKVTKVNDTTINCRPVMNRVVNGESVELPEFIEVPPITLQGGASYVALPVAVNDYCVLMFTERCFDRWYDGKDFRSPAEARMHDYSDGLALVGVNPLSAAIAIPEETTINGVMRLGSENPSDFAALASLVIDQLDALKTAIEGTAIVATDGGASFKTTLLTALAAWPGSVASTKVKAE